MIDFMVNNLRQVVLWMEYIFTNTVQMFDQVLAWFIYGINFCTFTNILNFANSLVSTMFTWVGFDTIFDSSIIFASGYFASEVFSVVSFVMEPWLPLSMINVTLGLLVVAYFCAFTFRVILWVYTKVWGST